MRALVDVLVTMGQRDLRKKTRRPICRMMAIKGCRSCFGKSDYCRLFLSCVSASFPRDFAVMLARKTMGNMRHNHHFESSATIAVWVCGIDNSHDLLGLTRVSLIESSFCKL